MTNSYTHNKVVYSIPALWKLSEDFTVKSLPIPSPDVDNYMEAYTWGGGKSPRRVLKACDNSHGHMVRILSADLKYPIVLAPNFGVIDGLHKIAKAVHTGESSIAYVKFDCWQRMFPAIMKIHKSAEFGLLEDVMCDQFEKVPRKDVLVYYERETLHLTYGFYTWNNGFHSETTISELLQEGFEKSDIKELRSDAVKFHIKRAGVCEFDVERMTS